MLEKLLTCDLQPFVSAFSFPEMTSDFRESQVLKVSTVGLEKVENSASESQPMATQLLFQLRAGRSCAPPQPS